MLSETVVSTLLLTSVTGAGLVVAIYALITPLSDKIFEARVKNLKSLLEEFDKEFFKITTNTAETQARFNRLRQLQKEIKKVRDFPRYLGIGIVITFVLFAFSFIADALLFFCSNPNYL